MLPIYSTVIVMHALRCKTRKYCVFNPKSFGLESDLDIDVTLIFILHIVIKVISHIDLKL